MIRQIKTGWGFTSYNLNLTERIIGATACTNFEILANYLPLYYMKFLKNLTIASEKLYFCKPISRSIDFTGFGWTVGDPDGN